MIFQKHKWYFYLGLFGSFVCYLILLCLAIKVHESDIVEYKYIYWASVILTALDNLFLDLIYKEKGEKNE